MPVSARFFSIVAAYYDGERPRTSGTDRVFVVLKGPRRGQPLSAAGLDEIVEGARRRAGLEHVTCHQLRHTLVRRFLPGWQVSAGGIDMFRPQAVAVVRYRYRGTKIPTPWASAPARIPAQ